MLVLVRDNRVKDAILGRILFCGHLICYTLENASKAIPCGVYTLLNSKSPKFKRELPLVFNGNVPEKRGIRIHSGNSAKDSGGCILVGMCRDCVKGTLFESKNAETMVTMLCRSVINLAIVEDG